MVQSDTKKVEIVEIQDEKVSGDINGSETESKCKIDTRWGDKVQVKKEPVDGDKDKKTDNKLSVKKEIAEIDKEKK